jgi:hypothetical protein
VGSSGDGGEGAQSWMLQRLVHERPIASRGEIVEGQRGDDDADRIVHRGLDELVNLLIAPSREALLRPTTGSSAALHVSLADVARDHALPFDDSSGEATAANE